MAEEPSADDQADLKTAKIKPRSGSGSKAHGKARASSDGKPPAAVKAARQPAAKSTPAEPADAGPESKGDEARPRKAASVEQPGVAEPWLRELLRQTPSWLTSMVVHMVILLVLAAYTLPAGTGEAFRQLVISPDKGEMDELDELENEQIEQLDLEAAVANVVAVESDVEPDDPEVSPFDDVDAAAVAVELSEFGLEKAPRNDLLATVGAYKGDGLSGRGKRARAALAAKSGGSKGSEKAVAMALKWLASVQCPDGGWSFDHTMAPGGNQSRNPGRLRGARNGATGLALLPFLGAGQTHKTGNYKRQVQAGLYFLAKRMKVSNNGGSLHEGGGSMYSHGIASIALCEAYAMTRDQGLQAPAQLAINFICYAQDPVGGGWRYTPRQKGDTSVVGWQIMALKSAHMAYLQVPPIVAKKACAFLDSVQTESGAKYGYTSPGAGSATTAIGLLCRMYLGWKKGNPALERGVHWLGNTGPTGNMYYNYYATQVMRHWEGKEWKKWNSQMRDRLVNSQAKAGHEAGSWYMRTDGHARQGGRLYCTAMATMILEVYYRHMPIYGKQAAEDDFPLD